MRTIAILPALHMRSATYDVSCGSSVRDALGRDVRPWTKIRNNSLDECSLVTSKWKSLIDMDSGDWNSSMVVDYPCGTPCPEKNSEHEQKI